MVVKLLRVALHAALAQLQPLLAAQQHQNLIRSRCPQKSFFELTWYRNLDERCKKHIFFLNEKETYRKCMKLLMQQTFSRSLFIRVWHPGRPLLL